MSHVVMPHASSSPTKGSAAADRAHFFIVLSRLAQLSATTSDLPGLMSATLGTSLEHLPLSGLVVWVRAHEQDLLTPGMSRLPRRASISAISEDAVLMQQALQAGWLLLSDDAAQPLVMLPETLSLAIAPIRSDDTLLGLLGYIAHATTLAPLRELLEASANLLSGPFASAWLRRQQAEADDVATTLFQFASELRTQRSLNDILSTLNNLALRVFNCDWSGVSIWQDDGFHAVQITTRVGQVPVHDEPVLRPHENPLLEILLSDQQLLCLPDLREQPGALPLYLERHGLRGLVLVPLQERPDSPLGLLSLGYRAPLVPFSGRTTALANGLARMVATALEWEDAQECTTRAHGG